MTESAEDKRTRLDGWRTQAEGLTFEGLFVHGEATLLRELIAKVIAFDGPEGDPVRIREKSAAYTRAAGHVRTVHDDVKAVADAGLPEVWVGEAGSRAADVVKAAGNNAAHMAEVFAGAGRELSLLSDGVAQARSTHDYGLQAAHAARGMLGEGLTVDTVSARKARTALYDALSALRGAVDTAESAGERAERELDKLTSDARAGRLDSRHLDDADRVVLADTAVPGGDRTDNEILSTRDLERVATRLDGLSPQDRKSFDTLLDTAKSPEERAYLTKALAAGYGIERITSFRAEIHPYGDDPKWLRRHLTPVVTQPDGERADGQKHDVTSGVLEWTQRGPTCVAYSTLVAHAMTDPVYTLELSTGGHPGDPEYDNPAAFNRRMREEEERIYDEREVKQEHGMSNQTNERILREEVAPHTGGSYDHVRFRTDADREEALPGIRDAVNEGRPVEVSLLRKGGGHDVLVIGQDGARLQIYDPDEGRTTWMDEGDFVNGNWGDAVGPQYHTTHSARVPTG